MNKSQFLSTLKFVSAFFNFSDRSAWFNFSYTWSDGTRVMGIVDGNLQADKNTVTKLSNVLAFVTNLDGIFISEFFDIPILGANNHLTLDGSSLEFGFTNNKGDIVKFLGSTSNFLFTTSLTIDNVRIIPFETVNSDKWVMFQCFLDTSQYCSVNKVVYLHDQGKEWSKERRKEENF